MKRLWSGLSLLLGLLFVIGGSSYVYAGERSDDYYNERNMEREYEELEIVEDEFQDENYRDDTVDDGDNQFEITEEVYEEAGEDMVMQEQEER